MAATISPKESRRPSGQGLVIRILVDRRPPLLGVAQREADEQRDKWPKPGRFQPVASLEHPAT